MSKPLKFLLLAVAGCFALLILTAIALRLFVDPDVYKSRLQATASDILGMEVRIDGRLGIDIFPTLHLTLRDTHLRNQGTEFVSAKEITLGIELFPLFRREIRIDRIRLKQPTVSIERDQDGRFNFAGPQTGEGTLPDVDLVNVSLADGTLVYADKRSGTGYEAAGCDLDMPRLRISGGKSQELMNKLILTADLSCREIRGKDFMASDLRVAVTGKDGVFDLDPFTLHVFGAQGSGTIRADYSGTTPLYDIDYSLPQLDIAEIFKTRTAQKVSTGAMDFTAELSMRGNSIDELRRAAAGRLSLRGENLTFHGSDIDSEIARIKSTQRFSLVDAGAFLFAGPFGLAVTKGYDFANVLQGSGGSSEIRALVSDWKVTHGIAQTEDVAMATDHNRIALKGKVDFVNQRFDDLTAALIDTQGCAVMQQKIQGTFEQPEVAQTSALQALVGPAVGLLKKGKALLIDEKCAVFYSGSVAPPG